MPYDYDDDTDDDHDHENDSYTAAGAAPGASVLCSFSRSSSGSGPVPVPVPVRFQFRFGPIPVPVRFRFRSSSGLPRVARSSGVKYTRFLTIFVLRRKFFRFVGSGYIESFRLRFLNFFNKKRYSPKTIDFYKKIWKSKNRSRKLST